MNNIKKAFTLAEVLTVIVVIGVVAILVLPNIIDSSEQKTNEMAAKKAKLDVTQAAMRVQAECPRGHGCDVAKIKQIIKDNLPNRGDTKYGSSMQANATDAYVVVDVDNDKVTDLHYKIDVAKAEIEEHASCNLTNYIKSTACTVASFKTFDGKTSGSATKADGTHAVTFH